MLDVQEKSQPKLVYSHASHNDCQRDEEGKTTPTTRRFVTETIKDVVNNQGIEKQESQLKEAGPQLFKNKQPLQEQKEQHNEQTQTKQVVDRRELPEQEQPIQPKQIDIIYISTKKGPAINDVFTKNENLQTSTAPQGCDVDKEPHKRYPQQNKDIVKSSHTDRLQTICGADNEINSSVKSSVPEKITNASSPSTATSAERRTKLSVSPPPTIQHAASISTDSSVPNLLKYSGLNFAENPAPKQIYAQSTAPSNNQQIRKQHFPCQQEDQQLIIHQPEQVLPVHTRKIQDAILHASTIKVHSYPLKQQETSPVKSKWGNSGPLTNIAGSTTLISCQPHSLAMSSSVRNSEGITEPELNQDSVQSSVSPSSPSTCSSTTNPPKSILKNAVSLDQPDLSVSSKTNMAKSADFDSSSTLTAHKDLFAPKGSVSVVKGPFQSNTKGKIDSPPLKRHGTIEAAGTRSGHNKGKKVLKKSVTFNSEVRLHLDDQVSMVDSLPVEA